MSRETTEAPGTKAIPHAIDGSTVERDLDLNMWEKAWAEDNIGFHKNATDALLVKYFDRLVGGREKQRVFFPLCGKSLDMKWVHEQGHVVIGVEYSEKGICDFFKENNIPYVSEPCSNLSGKLFKTADESLRIYCCDIFDFSSDIEAPFDAVWDRGAFVAINKGDRGRYASHMTSLLSPDAQCLVVGKDYNQDLYAGPPWCVDQKDLEEAYENYDVKFLEKADYLNSEKKEKGFDRWCDLLYLLTPKSRPV